MSNEHRIATALDWCLRGNSAVPPEVRDYFDAVCALNRERNDAIADALHRVLVLLQEIGVRPILLKGAAGLVEGAYPPGARFIGDVDLLVRKEEAQAAAACLLENDFSMSNEPLPEGHHHLQMLHDAHSGLGVELHTRVETDPADAILSFDWFVSEARTVRFRDLDVQLPDPTRMVAHNIVHSQLNHEGFSSGRIELRQLLDLAVLRTAHETVVDWADVERRFEQAGHRQAFTTYLSLDAALLGQKLPSLTSEPVEWRVQRVRDQIDPRPRAEANDVVTWTLPAALIRHFAGHCWHIELPAEFLSGDTSLTSQSSTLQLFEDEMQLGPGRASHDIIQRDGGGTFSHWRRELYFSTPDNSDPRTAGRVYRAKGSVPSSTDVLGLLAAERQKPAELASLRQNIADMDFASFRLPIDRAYHFSGYCWRIPLPEPFVAWDNEFDPHIDGFELLENGLPLGPAHASHELIKKHGRGAFAHWEQELFFSTSDNSDPRTSGATYVARGWVAKSAQVLTSLVAERAARATDAHTIAVLESELEAMRRSLVWRLRLQITNRPWLHRMLKWCLDRFQWFYKS